MASAPDSTNPFWLFQKAWYGWIDNALPFSGNVNQTITTPWNLFSPTIVVQGKTNNADAEKVILEEVGSYGRQIGILNEALAALLKKVDGATLTEDDLFRILRFKDQMKQIRHVKKRLGSLPSDKTEN